MPNSLSNINLSPFAEDILHDAHQLALASKHEFVMPEHFILATIHCCERTSPNREFDEMFYGISSEIRDLLEDCIPATDGKSDPQLSSLLKTALKNAHKILQQKNMPIPATAIVIAIINLDECICSNIISHHVSERDLPNVLNYIMKLDGKSLRGYDLDNDNDELFDDDDDFDDFTSGKATQWHKHVTDLNHLRIEKHNAIIGRNAEMAQMAQVLCRRDKNNALIVGESGVGKSAIVKGFIASLDRFPPKISNLPAFELSIANILANAQYQGDMEQRITSVMNGIKSIGGGIIVIDDIHTLAGSKGDANGSRDLTGVLLPYLDDEQLRFIGITTFEEITRHLDSHTRFLRRFRHIDIDEPSQQEAIEILNGVKRQYEKYHDLRVAPGVVERAVKLGKRFLSNRALPDSAIDILDEAGAYRELNPLKGYKKQVIHPDLIDSIVARMGKIETKIIDDNDTAPLRNLGDNLRQRIFGQDEAINQVVEAVLTARAGLTDDHKPQANLLFVGPTGVGKTEVARVLAEELGVTLHKFDMSEYSESYSVSKLIGSSPGYVGYEEGGRLTEAVRKNPHCVLLLDEIEKAHEKVFDSLLQVMDYATLTDSRGRKVDFTHAIIIMTSNSGAQFAKQAGIGFGSTVTMGKAMLSEVKKTFKPEFINRLSGIVVFNDMSRDMATLILNKKIKELNTRLSERNVEVSLSPAAMQWLLDNGFSARYGAREIERVISRSLKPLLVNEILFGKLAKKGRAEISVSGNSLNIAIKKQA